MSADGALVEIGADCMIIESAVLRGTPQRPLIMADRVLAGPRASSVALSGTVHIGCVVPPLARIPVGWVAVGEPARMYPSDEAEVIWPASPRFNGGFVPFVFAASRCTPRCGVTPRRWAAIIAMTRSSRPQQATSDLGSGYLGGWLPLRGAIGSLPPR